MSKRVTLSGGALDPMPFLRQAMKDRVNAGFSTSAASTLHADQAHTQKRAWAEVQDQRLKPEADLRGISVADLAALILSKPDTIAERELRRQQIMMRIEAATTPQELDQIQP
jgi:hypothetical protein